jgi:hypothetical protein
VAGKRCSRQSKRVWLARRRSDETAAVVHMHAEPVVTAAVQDGARVASSETGTLADGQAVAAALLHDGLGPTAPMVTVLPTEDATAVRFEATGTLPAIFPWGPVTTIPLHATALMARDRFIP